MHFENLANASHLTDRYNFWKKYAYLWGAAADTGYNFNMLIIFIAFSAAKTVTMPNWWGNNAKSVERCTYCLSSASMTSSPPSTSYRNCSPARSPQSAVARPTP